MPTTKPGDLEPGKSSSLPMKKMDEVYQLAPAEWKETLELICTLIQENESTSDVMPGIDHDRIRYFVRQILEHQNRPEWMTEVIKTLGMFLKMDEIKVILTEEQITKMNQIEEVKSGFDGLYTYNNYSNYK